LELGNFLIHLKIRRCKGRINKNKYQVGFDIKKLVRFLTLTVRRLADAVRLNRAVFKKGFAFAKGKTFKTHPM
jgi:hypothetical protein